jgi:hypothetical protein
VRKQNNPRQSRRESHADSNEKEEHLGAIEYIRHHKIRSFLVAAFVFSLGGPLNFFGSNPRILYLPAIVACACILYFTHAYVASLKSRPNSLDKQPPTSLERTKLSNTVAPSHPITENAFEILGKISARGTLEKEDAINGYIKGSIDWKVGLYSIRAIKGDSEHIEATFIPVAIRPPVHPFIICVLSRKEYAYLDKDVFKPPSPVQVFRLTGVISDIEAEGASTIKIDNATAQYLGGNEVTSARMNPTMRPTAIPLSNTTISSTNQSGGFTGINQGTVNVGPQPRSIASDARLRLVNGLRKAPNSFVGIDTPLGDTEAAQFADELRKAFEEAGWKVAVAQASWDRTPTGLHLAFHRFDDVPAHAAILQEALLEAGFVAPADAIDESANEHTVRLIVGTKPK